MYGNNFAKFLKKSFLLTKISLPHVSCHSSSQNAGACDFFPSSDWEKWDILKIIALLFTKQEKCSYKPLLNEKIHDLMQAFPLDTESH